ncbi:histidine kinase-, DNA gyrase B-, and HSP90-like ATPase family protein [Corynebacterium simulans]|uniref:sensor histidine kinase n=1 Tax=Corynebacterium TaxID=1716 RepID=UPI0007805499|nr:MULTISPECIES: histidine kinase [Corynebacterium]AMO89050.1 histidine kinase-, DNA gyrase B-, and HSP90-like ATPase family protein [Corynebacterium simulans]OFT47198.1 two-component sensor histidine kinase [Corynebacterium sp. HMSC06G04]
MATFKSVAWNLVLALLCIPAVVVSVVMLPWIPLVASLMAVITRGGARWLGVKIRYRTPHRWFDWQQFYHLLIQLLLSILSMALWLFVGSMTVVFFIAPFFTDRFNIGSLVIENRALAIVVSWTFGCLCLLVLIFGAKFLTFLSVSTTRLALESDARATLIDAFSGERRRIERELHDGPQQYLTALKLNLAAAKRGDTAALDAADHNASLALSALRDTVRGIAPQVLFDNGLIAALEELLVHSGLEITLECKGVERSLDETSALLAYHCVAEGLTNAVKHGEATAATVKLDYREGIKISITDNGHGLTAGEGTGIAGLEERAIALGGSVKLEDTDQGARLRMRLP